MSVVSCPVPPRRVALPGLAAVILVGVAAWLVLAGPASSRQGPSPDPVRAPAPEPARAGVDAGPQPRPLATVHPLRRVA